MKKLQIIHQTFSLENKIRAKKTANHHTRTIKDWPCIQGTQGPRTDRSELVRDQPVLVSGSLDSAHRDKDGFK